MPVLLIIAALAVLIVVHEMGHFFAARLQGIHVNRFSIGFGPALWKYQGPETEYALRAIPLGGFVGFPDDDPESEIPPNDPDLLRNRPVLDRAIVISAGVIANLIFAYFVLVGQVGLLGVPVTSQPGILVPEVVTQSSTVAADAGIQNGDVILSANGQEFGRSPRDINELQQIIRNSVDQPIALIVKRGEQTLPITLVPEAGENGVGTSRSARGLGEMITMATQEFQYMVVTTAKGYLQLFTNFAEVANQVSGPVGIVEQGAKLTQDNVLSILPFTAIISINLAILNILPLPALDGGQLVFLLIEALRGKPLPQRIQEGVMQTGLLLLLGLGIVLIVRDTVQLDVFQR
jgi:membrane-associated protease RseP (regulator of RpoE activity)